MKRIAVCLVLIGAASGFLFPQSVNMKIGLFVPTLQSDLWDINMRNLTFNKSNMTGACYSGEYEFYFGRRISFSMEVGSYAKTVYAEYRDYTLENGSPIDQDISLRIVPIEANVKIYPMGHRHSLTPYIGAGVGVYSWTYQQWGDFINFEDGTVSEGFAETRKFNFGLNGRIGMALRFHPRLAFVLEGKYTYARGRLSEYFEDFDPLDLGGFTVNAGVNIFFR